MTEISPDELRRHIKRLHECRAKPSSASICYAWSSFVESSENQRFYAVLHTNDIDSPAKAVWAAIVNDYRAQS